MMKLEDIVDKNMKCSVCGGDPYVYHKDCVDGRYMVVKLYTKCCNTEIEIETQIPPDLSPFAGCDKFTGTQGGIFSCKKEIL